MTLDARIAAALDPIEEVRVAWVFGSQVNGRARDDSDLDLAVVYPWRLGSREREDVRRRIVDALTVALGPLGERTDVVDVAWSDSAVAFAALRDGHRVVSRSEGERIEASVRIMRRYDDDGPRRELFRAAAIRAGRRMGAAVGSATSPRPGKSPPNNPR